MTTLGKWPLYLFRRNGHFLIVFIHGKRATFLFGLWQMAILSFVYGKMATFTKMTDGHIVVFKMADSQVYCLWPQRGM